jgi:hypothetical protein
MRDGKASRTASKRSRKEPLSRVGTTSSHATLARAPSSVNALVAAGAAINRHGTPMHSATTKPRTSAPKPQPVRRPTTRKHTQPNTIFEDVELDTRAMKPSSLDSSTESYSTGSRKLSYEYQAYEVAPGMEYKQRDLVPDAEEGTSPPRPKVPAASSDGCLGVVKNSWELWKEINRLGVSEEGLAIAMITKKVGSNDRDLERGRPREPAPRSGRDHGGQEIPLQQIPSESRPVPVIIEPPAALVRSGTQRMVLQYRRPNSATSQMTTFSQLINAGRSPKRAIAAPSPSSALRQEVRYDSAHDATEAGERKQREVSPPTIRVPPQAQAPPYENRNFIRDNDIDQGSFIGGFSDFDGAYRAPTMTSTYARMSHVDPNDWQSIHTRGPSRARAQSPSSFSSVYSRATDGRLYSSYARPGSPPKGMPRAQGEYRTNPHHKAPYPINPWRESRPVSPLSDAYPSFTGDREPPSPLVPQRDDGRLNSYVPARAEWPARDQKDAQGDNGRRGTDFYDFYRESGPVFRP